MPDQPKSVIKLEDLPLTTWNHGSFFGGTDASFGRQMGLTDLGMSYNKVEPGHSGCPFHSHRGEDEAFVILSGTGTWRFGETRSKVGPGDVCAAPKGGPETAHQLINDGTETLVYLGLSSFAPVEVCEYPDSGKVLTFVKDRETGRESFNHMVKKGESVDYWEGE